MGNANAAKAAADFSTSSRADGWDTLFKVNRSFMAHNHIDVGGPSAQRSTHFGLISSKVVNASDPCAMAANVVENRFDDVGEHP